MPELATDAHARRVHEAKGCRCQHLDPDLVQAVSKTWPLQSLVAEWGDFQVRCDDCHLVAIKLEQLGDARAHEIAVAVVDDDLLTRWPLVFEHDLLRREHEVL